MLCLNFFQNEDSFGWVLKSLKWVSIPVKIQNVDNVLHCNDCIIFGDVGTDIFIYF